LDWDFANNLLSIGTETHIITFAGSSRGGIINTVHDDANNIFNYLAGAHTDTANLGPLFQGYRSRGTEGTPTIVADGDELVELSGGGFDGTDFESAGKINLIVNGTPGNDDMPGAWVFFTTPDGGTTPVEHFRIEQDGTLNVAGTSAYEALVTDDDDIPNKKFVDDAVSAAPFVPFTVGAIIALITPTAKAAVGPLGIGFAVHPPGSTAFITDDSTGPTSFILAYVDGTTTWIRSDSLAPIT